MVSGVRCQVSAALLAAGVYLNRKRSSESRISNIALRQGVIEY
ncbi:hypothetical protein D1AOALGA4SA_10000 [Olavius algarvensis Delta 1 endosymbiont]|nr:hypothetical protein D1AOALGA4SA_10000 [Olavius algarvensis Delta 1 endosymbiont]